MSTTHLTFSSVPASMVPVGQRVTRSLVGQTQSMYVRFVRAIYCPQTLSKMKYAYVVQVPSALQQGLVPRIKQASSSTKVFNYKNMQAQRTIIVKHLATQHLCVVCGVCVSCPRPTSLSRQCPHPCCRSVGQRVTRSLSRANSIHAWTICP